MYYHYFRFLPILLALSVPGAGAQPQRSQPPTPTHANVPYGPHERNVLDLWLAPTDRPAPLVIYYHGGGFRNGDKRSVNPRLTKRLLAMGIHVAAANYRLSGTDPYPAQMLDSARALQFLRYQASKYNIDPERIGAYGGSAGSGISQWLAYRDDMADPDSADPVLRQSTRLAAIGPFNAQTSYDPRFINKLMNTTRVHEALLQWFRMDSAADANNPRFFADFEDSSPINFFTADDPPVIMYFNQRNDPLPPNSSGREHIHHPKFGFLLQEKAEKLGVEFHLLLREDHPDGFPVDEYAEFFREKLLRQ